MLVQVALILVAYCMGRKGIDLNTLIALTNMLLGDDKEK